MRVSDRGLALIKEFEGGILKAYRCPAGVLTIGYGHTGADVVPGMFISPAQAEALLAKDIRKFERAVAKECKGLELSQGQFDALVSFTYNLGISAFKSSTLLKLIKESNFSAAAQQFELWVYAGDRKLSGLVRRRAAERKLFLS